MGARFLAAMTALLVLATSNAAEFRIQYAEPLRVRAGPDSGTQKADPRQRLAFEAYGREFQVDLELNHRLLKSFGPDAARRLSSLPYRGTLSGLAGSWVRLTRTGDRFSGAIWDGNDLYMIVPEQDVSGALTAPVAGDTTGTLIFRLTDTVSGLAGEFCGTSSERVGRADGRAQYKALVGELQSQVALAAADVSGEIEVAVLADSLFRAQHPGDAPAVMLARMNVVDGIFAEQVGILIVPTDLTVFTAADDPFTGTTSATGLLEQLGNYRNERPTIRGRALAHLMTGRDLDGNTAGIAYIDALCEGLFGVSLSEGWRGDAFAPLIMAHELGHNFGAPHDAESGACAATPAFYLMAPNVNSSNQFSQCSIQQMQPAISTAACVLPARIADVAVSVDPPVLDVFVNREFDLPVNVTAVGDQPVEGVVLTVGVGSLSVISASVPGGTCTVNSSSATCELGSMAAAESRQALVRVRGSQLGGFQGEARVTARVDRNSANNVQGLTFNVRAGSDVSFTASPANIRVLTQQPFEMNFDASATGVEVASAVVARIFLGSDFQIDEVLPEAGTCTISGAIECQLGDMTPGQSRRIVVRARATRADSPGSGHANVTASNDEHSLNNNATFRITVDSRQDVGVQPHFAELNQVVDVPFDYTLDVFSYGTEAATNVALTIATASLAVQQANAEGGSCQIQTGQVLCTLGSIGPSSARRVNVRLFASQISDLPVHTSVRADQDDNRNNDTRSPRVIVRYATDIELRGPGPLSAIETLAGRLNVDVRSMGNGAATNVNVSAIVPPGYPVTAASITGGACTTTPTTATCTIASLAAGQTAYLWVDYRNDQPGSFTASFSATADAEVNTANNAASVAVTVAPYSDMRIESAPERIRTTPGQVLHVPVVIAADRTPMSNVTFHVNAGPFTTVQALSVVGGNCTLTETWQATCSVAQIEANTSRQVDLTLRTDSSIPYPNNSFLTLRVNAWPDHNPFNDQRSVPFGIDIPGDASVSVAQSTVSATARQQFSFPQITVTGIETVENAIVDISLPPNTIVINGSVNGGTCATASYVRCTLGRVAAGESRSIGLTLRIDVSGSLTSTVQLSALNDRDASNNVRTVSLTVTEPPPPSGGGGGGGGNGGGGGGGGGGGLSLLALLCLGSLAGVRQSKRQAAPLA